MMIGFDICGMIDGRMHSDEQPYVSAIARKLRRLSRRTSPFLKVFILCATFCLSIYICIDLVIDWRPAGWGVLDRLTLVVQCGILAITPGVVGVIVVAAQRLRPDLQVGQRLAEYSPVDINTRYVKNTVEQFVLFFVGISGMSAYVTYKDAATIPILTAMFIAGRCLFWFGYHKYPYVRAFGFGLTFYPTVIVIAWVVLRTAFGIYVPI